MGELVLLLGRDPYRRAGGMESYGIAHAHAARRAGYAPHMFSMAARGAIADAEFGSLHRVGSPVRPVRSINCTLQAPWLVPALVRFLRDRPGPHVIHGFSAWSDLAARAARRLAVQGVDAVPVATFFTTIEHEASAKLQSPVVRGSAALRLAHRAELAWTRAVTTPSERRAARQCRAVVVNYQSVARLVSDAYGPGLPIRHVTYAPATAFAAEVAGDAQLLPPGDAPLIVSVSRHDGRKGLDVLIRALAALRDRGVAFRACLCGTGVLLEGHRRLVASLGLGDRVALPGAVPAVMPYLRASDVYVLPSLEEGSGSVAVLEALQAGAAVVSTNVDGMPEDLTDEHDALLVEPGDPDALAAALARLLADPALRERLARAGRALYERRFSPDAAAAALAGLYGSLGLEPRSGEQDALGD